MLKIRAVGGVWPKILRISCTVFWRYISDIGQKVLKMGLFRPFSGFLGLFWVIFDENRAENEDLKKIRAV